MWLRIRPRLRIDRQAALDTAVMYLSMERFSSKMMPRFLTLSDGVTMVSPTLICVMLTFDLLFRSDDDEFCLSFIQLQEFLRHPLM